MKSRRVAAGLSLWYDPLFHYMVIPFSAFLLKLILFTCRLIKLEGLEQEQEALRQSGGRAVYASWHQRVVYHANYLERKDLTAMVSKSRDGELAARLLSLFGIKSVRGSSTRGGSAALKELTDKVKKGANGGMILDGPVGPARVAKIGAVVIARNAGVPVIPLSWGADRCWVLNSWDRLMIPKPFARIVYCFGEPIWISPDKNNEDLEIYRRHLEDDLNRVTRWCDNQFGEERPWRKVRKEGVPEVGRIF